MVVLPSGVVVSGFRSSLPETSCSDHAAELRSIPQQSPQPLSAVQALCEELSCHYLALVPVLPNTDSAEKVT